MPFLTDLDTRAAVKGSRDPLGIQSIWTRMGRHVVGNLTTVSNSICDFKTLLLGYYFVHRVAEHGDRDSELAGFLKWEQLAAYARGSINGDWEFRGTERVRKFLDEGPHVTLSASNAHQILSNQKIYGLWGLYTVPARASGLLEPGSTRLTVDALELVEGLYVDILSKHGARGGIQIIELLSKPECRVDMNGKEKKVVQAVAGALRRDLVAEERKFFRRHLLEGGPSDSTHGLQRQMAAILEQTLSDDRFEWSPPAMEAMAKEASGNGDDGKKLAFRLRRIRACESVLAPMSMLFAHMLGMNEQSVSVLLKRLKETWGSSLDSIDVNEVRELSTEIENASPGTSERWLNIASTAAHGDYEQLVRHLIEQNSWVMSARGGAPWIDNRQGKFNVRFREESGELPRQKELRKLWRFPYFLDSLRAVASTLKESDRG